MLYTVIAAQLTPSPSLLLTNDSSTPPRPRLLAGVPQAKLAEADTLLTETEARLKQLELAVRTQQPDFAGVRVADVLRQVARLEVLEAPGL